MLSALRSAAGQNLAAVGSRHSLAEAVLFFALTLLGLVGTEHVRTTPCQFQILYGFACPYPGRQDTTKQLLYYNVGG